MRLVFDIETDGLLRDLSCVHCIVTYDLDTGETTRYDDTGKYDSVTTGVTTLMGAKELYGHNIVSYDFEALRECYPFWEYKGKVYDTLILSRLFYFDMLDRDLRSKPANMPANLYGRHSLESYGYRLSGPMKSEYGKQLDGDWSTYTEQMLEYCVTDVMLNVELVKVFLPKIKEYSTCIDLEHKSAAIMSWQEREGYPFDSKAGQQLESKLRTEIEEISNEMRETFSFVPGKEFVPARDNKPKGYFADSPMTRLKEFSPTSRDHISWAFQQFRGWVPIERTTKGKVKIDEDVLKNIGTDEALKFARILELQKALGQLSEGKNSWLRLVDKDNRIHHSCFLNTVTGRNAHMRPNLGNVNSAPEYRALFGPGEGRIQVGSDASSLELRALGHYLARYDGGKFAKEVVEGDIHARLASIYKVDRTTSKVVTYSMLYGCGDLRLGDAANAERDVAAATGKRIREAVLNDLDGFAELSRAVLERAKSGVIRGLDGRPIRIRKAFSALNALLQSCGAVICKSWLVRTNELLIEAGIDYWPLAFVHDEMQLSVRADQKDMAADLIKMAMKDVEQTTNFRVSLDCDVKFGANWGECH